MEFGSGYQWYGLLLDGFFVAVDLVMVGFWYWDFYLGMVVRDAQIS